jgi:hypothetical protein
MKFPEATKRMSLILKSDKIRKEISKESPENLPFLSDISKLNKRGLLTIDSQPGIKTSFLDEMGMKVKIHQRSYIIGFMKPEKAEKLNKALAFEEIVMIFVYIDDSKEDTKYYPASHDIPVTITEKETIPDKYHINTHISTAMPLSQFEFEMKNAHINKNEKVVMVAFIDLKWNRSTDSSRGVLTILLQYL